MFKIYETRNFVGFLVVLWVFHEVSGEFHRDSKKFQEVSQHTTYISGSFKRIGGGNAFNGALGGLKKSWGISVGFLGRFHKVS